MSVAEPAAPSRRGLVASRLRTALVWAGLATLAVISALAIVHLVADLRDVITGPGRTSGILMRLALAGALGLAGLGLGLLVAWLSGSVGRREWAAIAIGFAALVLIRVFLSWQLDTASGEPVYYPQIAETVLAGEPDFRGRPPGYALALASVYTVVGDRQLAAEGLNLLLAVLAGGAVLALARGLYGARTGALALLAYALWPAGALMSSVSMPHVAFDTAVVLAAWAAAGLPAGWRGDAASGALAGISQYLRPMAIVLLPSLILARLWQGGPLRLRAVLGTVAISVLACLLVLVPVMLATLVTTGSPSISTSDWGGHSFFIGTYEPSGGTYTEEADRLLKEAAGPVPLPERSAVGTRIALQRIREDPLGIAALAVRKQDTLWGTEHYGIQYSLRQGLRRRPEDPAATVPILLSQGFYVLVLVSATAGLWLVRRRPDALVPLAVTLLWTVSAMHALLEVRDRHHSYVIPVLLPLSALALAAAWEALARRAARSRTAGSGPT